MNQGRKPDITITAKPKQGGSDDRKKLVAIWENENGMLSGKLGFDVKEIVLNDGTVIDGNANGWFINAKDWRQGKPSRGAKKQGFDDDDIPF